MPRCAIRSLVLVVVLALSACRQDPEIDGKPITDVVNLLRHDDWAVQSATIDSLAKVGQPAVLYVLDGLPSKDPALRRGAIITLGRIGPAAKEAIKPLLVRIAREEVALLRAEILKSLATIDPLDPQVVAEFNKRLKDQAVEVREAAQAGLAAGAPKPLPAPRDPKEPGGAVPEAERLLLREAVAALLAKEKPGVSFGLVAEVIREAQRAAVVWPAIREGKVLDDDVVAYVFTRQSDGSWVLAAGNLGLSKSDGANELAKALGGADKQRVVFPCGMPRDQLFAQLNEQGCAFQKALAANKPDQAVAAYERLVQGFSFPLAVYNDMIPEGLAKGWFCENTFKVDPACGGDSCPLQTVGKDKTESGQVVLRSCGTGVVISELRKAP
jgi:hypothetical protein